MSTVIREGEAGALPELAHSVHVEVQGLRPGREYWYRFVAGQEESEVARTQELWNQSFDRTHSGHLS